MEPRKWIYEKEKLMKEQDLGPIIEDAFYQERMMILGLDDKEIFDYMVSKMNYCSRKQLVSSRQFDIEIHPGDICFMDFGQAYQREIGYLHFGLVITIKQGKAFVVPLSGKYKTFLEAYDKESQTGKKHVMKLGYLPGLSKLSSLFLNDAKWINTSRIIEIKAHIDVESELFQEILERIIETILD